MENIEYLIGQYYRFLDGKEISRYLEPVFEDVLRFADRGFRVEYLDRRISHKLYRATLLHQYGFVGKSFEQICKEEGIALNKRTPVQP
ncbi:MAG: hypothetical protein ACMXYF_04880 [Candidatus Woesearchaeota archaeon]